MIKVLVVDDHAIVRTGLCHFLKTMDGMEVVGEAGTGREAVEAAARLKPDVVLLDMDLPDIDGMEVTEQIAAAAPDTAVLILTMYESEDIARRALSAGALGYLIKGTDPAELPEAIRAAAAGKIHVTPKIRDKLLLSRFRPGAAENPTTILSRRELQALMEMARGHNTTEIADKLCLSKSTVKTYKQRIYEKLGTDNLSDLVRICMKHGLIEKM